MDDTFTAELLARLAPLGELRAKRMFGGTGLYCDDVFFGLIAEDLLYFKVDEESARAYRAAGSVPFQPFPDKPSKLLYYEVPQRVQDRDEELLAWAQRALAAARERDAAKSKGEKKRATGGKKSKAKARASPASVPLTELQNIGPKAALRLSEVGIRTRADLERVGSVRAYLRVLEAGHAAPLDLLYVLEGALLGLRWDRLPAAVKQNLRERAGRRSER